MLLTFQKRQTQLGVRFGFSTNLRIEKLDRKTRKVFGWASGSADSRGVLIVDHDEDVIRPDELEKAAHSFALNSRTMGEMHENIGPGRLIESVFIDSQKRQAMELQGDDRIAWWVGFQVDDDRVWKRIEKGELTEFSIAGTATRIPSTEFPGAFELQHLEIDEVSLVDKGAGVGVRVTMFKRRADAEDGMELKWIVDTVKACGKDRVLAKRLVTSALEGLAKQGITLADIKAKLTVEEWEVLQEALAAAGAPPTEAPPTEAPVEAALDPMDPAAVPSPAEGEEVEPEKEDHEMSTEKLKKAYEAELSKLKNQVGDLQKRARLAEFEKVARQYEFATGTTEDIAKQLMHAADLRASGHEDLAKSIEDRIAREHELVAKSPLLKQMAKVQTEASDDPGSALLGHARKIRKDAGSPVKPGVAFLKACRENPDLYAEAHAERRSRQPGGDGLRR